MPRPPSERASEPRNERPRASAREIMLTGYNSGVGLRVEMEKRKHEIVASLDKISDEAAPILRITVENPTLVSNLRAEKKYTIEYLMEYYEVCQCCVALRCVALRCVALRCVALRCVALRCVALRWGLLTLYCSQLSESQIDALYRYAKAQYEIGNYSLAADCLFQYIPLSAASTTRYVGSCMDAHFSSFSLSLLLPHTWGTRERRQSKGVLLGAVGQVRCRDFDAKLGYGLGGSQSIARALAEQGTSG